LLALISLHLSTLFDTEIYAHVNVHIHIQLRLRTLFHVRFRIFLGVVVITHGVNGYGSLSEMVLPTFQFLGEGWYPSAQFLCPTALFAIVRAREKRPVALF
jgi:hypothetical protein